MIEPRLFIFAGNFNERMHYMGFYNGINFYPQVGYCESLEELHQYDFIEIYGMDGMLSHSPKRFNKKIDRKIDLTFTEYYGEQTSLF